MEQIMGWHTEICLFEKDKQTSQQALLMLKRCIIDRKGDQRWLVCYGTGYAAMISVVGINTCEIWVFTPLAT